MQQSYLAKLTWMVYSSITSDSIQLSNNPTDESRRKVIENDVFSTLKILLKDENPERAQQCLVALRGLLRYGKSNKEMKLGETEENQVTSVPGLATQSLQRSECSLTAGHR